MTEATRAESVVQKLPVAFPGLFSLLVRKHWLVALHADGRTEQAFPLRGMNDNAWWQVAGLITPVLDDTNLKWSMSSGDERGKYCAVVDRKRPMKNRPKSAVAFADQAGLVLVSAACAALLEGDS